METIAPFMQFPLGIRTFFFRHERHKKVFREAPQPLARVCQIFNFCSAFEWVGGLVPSRRKLEYCIKSSQLAAGPERLISDGSFALLALPLKGNSFCGLGRHVDASKFRLVCILPNPARYFASSEF